jgi:hypothetical protein
MAQAQDLTEGWTSTKMLPQDVKEFTANGTQYRVSSSMSFERYEAYQVLQVELGLARTFEQFHAELKEAYGLCNQVATGKPVFGDLAVLLRDLVIGAASIGEHQTPTVLKLCALFINKKGEDVRTIDEEIIEDKIADWREEGIDIRFFFGFALRSIPGYTEALRAASPDISLEKDGAQKPKAQPSTSKPASNPSAT